MKSSLIRLRDAVLGRVAPRKWHVVKRGYRGSVSICSSHRTRADAVLAIPLDDGDYGVMQQARIDMINFWSARAASLEQATTDTTSDEEKR